MYRRVLLAALKFIVPPLSCCTYSFHRSPTVDQLLSGFAMRCAIDDCAPPCNGWIRAQPTCACVRVNRVVVPATVAWWITHGTTVFYMLYGCDIHHANENFRWPNRRWTIIIIIIFALWRRNFIWFYGSYCMHACMHNIYLSRSSSTRMSMPCER